MSTSLRLVNVTQWWISRFCLDGIDNASKWLGKGSRFCLSKLKEGRAAGNELLGKPVTDWPMVSATLDTWWASYDLVISGIGDVWKEFMAVSE